MKRAAKVDDNQAVIVAALRKAGCHVTSLAPVGQGVPALLVGHRGAWHVLEVKCPDKTPAHRQLTPRQVEYVLAVKGRT